MTDNAIPAPKRRWFAFSLRTMFVVVTVVGLLAWWVHRNLEQVRERDRFLEWAKANDMSHGVYKAPDSKTYPPLPITWRLLGAERVDVFVLDPMVPASDQERVKAAFPEADFITTDDVSPKPLPRQLPPTPLPAN